MVKVILNGASGAMGKVVADLVAADENMEIVAGVDLNTDAKLETMKEIFGSGDINAQWMGYNRLQETNIMRTDIG